MKTWASKLTSLTPISLALEFILLPASKGWGGGCGGGGLEVGGGRGERGMPGDATRDRMQFFDDKHLMCTYWKISGASIQQMHLPDSTSSNTPGKQHKTQREKKNSHASKWTTESPTTRRIKHNFCDDYHRIQWLLYPYSWDQNRYGMEMTHTNATASVFLYSNFVIIHCRIGGKGCDIASK